MCFILYIRFHFIEHYRQRIEELEYIQRTLLKVLIEEKEYAEEKQIDLIVMGTRGRTGFKKLLLGSTASSVVTYSHCTVMVVK